MKRALLALVPLLLVCGLLELALRTTHVFNARLSWTEPDRDIGWRFTPGREYWFFAENDHAITGRINAMGWRDRERTQAAQPGTTRIAVLGDSFVEAFQVELDSTFVAILERTLNTRVAGAAFEVMNFGRSGMSPAEELIVLERDILARDPDIVLLVFTPQNDIADVNPATAGDTNRPFFRSVAGDSLELDASFVARRGFRLRELINPFKQHSALVSLVTERYNASRLARAQSRKAHGPRATHLTREQGLCTSSPDSVSAANYALCKQLIARIARRCAERGALFALASVPVAYEAKAVAGIRADDPSFDPQYIERDLANLAAERGFRLFPLAEAFAARARGGERLHWQHWNYAGHRLVAEQILSALASLAAPPATGSNASD